MHLFKKIIEKIHKTFLEDGDLFELLKGGSIVFLLKACSMLTGYIIMIYISNNYGAKIYGQYALGITVLSITLLLPRFGLDTALVRILGELKLIGNFRQVLITLKKVFSISFLIGSVISLIFFFFSDYITIYVFEKPDLADELSLIAFAIIPATFLYLFAAYFQAYKRTLNYILFNSALVNFVFIVVLFAFDFINLSFQPFSVYIFAVAITFSIAVVVAFREITNKKDIDEQQVGIKKNKMLSYKDILKISSPMLLSSSFVLIMNWLDIIMLGIFSSEEDVGIYNASQRLAAISGILLFAINAIATPKFIEYYSKKDFKSLEKTVKQSTKLIFFLTSPILLTFMFFPKEILQINGEEFVSGYLALIFLCIGKFINSISGSVGFILQMTDNQKIFQNVLLFSTILNGILNYVLIPIYGLEGAAFSSMITIAIWNIVLVIIVKNKFNFWTYYLPFLRK